MKVKGNWELKQDKVLLEAVKKYGKKWTLISKQLQNRRSENSVKNRYNSLIKNNKKYYQQDIKQSVLLQILLENYKNMINNNNKDNSNNSGHNNQLNSVFDINTNTNKSIQNLAELNRQNSSYLLKNIEQQHNYMIKIKIQCSSDNLNKMVQKQAIYEDQQQNEQKILNSLQQKLLLENNINVNDNVNTQIKCIKQIKQIEELKRQHQINETILLNSSLTYDSEIHFNYEVQSNKLQNTLFDCIINQGNCCFYESQVD